MIDVEYVRVDDKGRIVVPEAIRRQLGIKAPGIARLRWKEFEKEVLLEGAD